MSVKAIPGKKSPLARWRESIPARLALKLETYRAIEPALLDHGIATQGLPQALGGFLVAILVLSPEGLAAVQAALANRVQRTMNIALGSALATIGLTIPAVLTSGQWTGQKVELGLENAEAYLLLLTLLVCVLNFGSRRTNRLQGFVHLTLFATYIFLIFE